MSWLTWAVPGLVALVANLWGIGGPSLWRDEAVTAEVAARPYGSLLDTLRHVDAVHGVYYLALHPLIAAFGAGQDVIRLPSVAAVAVTAAVLALVGRRLVSAPAGLAAGLLLAVAFPQVAYYAHEGRSYAVVMALATITTYLFVRAVQERRAWAFAAYGGAAALTALVHLYSLPLLLAHAVALWPLRRDRGLLLRWGAAALAALAMAAPLALYARTQAEQVGWITPPVLDDWRRLATSLGGTAVLLIPLTALAILGAAASPPGLRWPAVPWLLVPPLLLLAVSYAQPVYIFRYVLYALPAMPLLAGAGLARLARPRPWAAVAAGLALALAALPAQLDVRRETAKMDDLRRLARILTAHELPGDGLVFHQAVYRRVTAAYPAAYTRLADPAEGRAAGAAHDLDGTLAAPAALRARLAGVRRLWYVDKARTVATARDGQVQRAVLGAFHAVRRWRFKGGAVYLLERGAQAGNTASITLAAALPSSSEQNRSRKAP